MEMVGSVLVLRTPAGVWTELCQPLHGTQQLHLSTFPTWVSNEIAKEGAN